MSSTSPSAASPSRRRDGNWGEVQSSYSYDYENGYAYANPTPYYGPPPSRGHHPPQEYWSYEPRWGPPPLSYDRYHSSERHMPPPPRNPRGAEPIQQQRSPRPFHRVEEPHHRIPTSPSSAYRRGRGPGPAVHHGKRDPRHPPTSQYSTEVMAKDKKGDPLSILANVSAGMTGKDRQQQTQSRPTPDHPRVPLHAPTSPLQRRSRPSPITPNQSSPENKQRSLRHQVTPTSRSCRSNEQSAIWDQSEYGYLDCPPPRRPLPSHGEYLASGQHEPNAPAVVERGSFDSQGDGCNYRDGAYANVPSRPYYYDEYPSASYWDNGPAHYPPPRWYHGPPQEAFHSDYAYEVHHEAFVHHSPAPPMPPHHAAPYTYVQQPRLEEKTILRKKFSWKHYPELERFLIANRDEYLKHSNMNYTAEQKQYNNWLTEKLLEVAAQHSYVFDPEDFNFVAIRDRIRCYYKSYVQTARKRGLKLPEKKQV